LERHAIARPFLQRRAIGGDGLLQLTRRPAAGVNDLPSELDLIEGQVRQFCEDRAALQHCTCAITRTFDMPSATFSPLVIDAIEQATERLLLPSKRMISGAFHDALFLARVAPSAMIFVPCRDGLSHNEAEYVAPEHVVNGARLMLEATLSMEK